MNKLLKDAIADAKAVRETALANAKFALEEAFAPKLQSMLSHKIKEEMEEDLEAEEAPAEEEETLESRMRNNAGIYEEDDLFGDEDGEGATTVEGEEVPAEEVPAEDDITDEEVPAEDDITDEELEELIRELDGDEEEVPVEDEDELMAEDDEMPTDEMKAYEDGDEEVDLEEIIRALREEDDEVAVDDSERVEKAEEELEEAYKVIKYLRTKLNEINLLNAKLLYVNKLIKHEGLTEGQKIKIIETFDRAKNVREAKLIYTTIAESVHKKST